jgi:hypothetical protein
MFERKLPILYILLFLVMKLAQLIDKNNDNNGREKTINVWNKRSVLLMQCLNKRHVVYKCFEFKMKNIIYCFAFLVIYFLFIFYFYIFILIAVLKTLQNEQVTIFEKLINK